VNSEVLLSKLSKYAISKPNKHALVYFDGQERNAINYLELWKLISSKESTNETNSLVLLEGNQSVETHIRYLRRLVQNKPTAFISPMTSRQAFDIWENERNVLQLRFEKFSRNSDRPGSINMDEGVLQFTSGTTGIRKGVVISYQKLFSHICSLEKALHIQEDDRVISWLPVYHDMGLISSFLMPLITGISTVLIDPVLWSFRPGIFSDAVNKYKGTLAWMPNFAFEHLHRYHTRSANTAVDLRSLRLLFNCSEPCRLETFNRFYGHFSQYGLRDQVLQCSYAMAENVFTVSYTRFKSPDDWLSINGVITSGSQLSGCKISTVRNSDIIDEEINMEQILISGDYLASNYVPESSDRFVNADGKHFFYSGDYGYLADGQLFVLGRIDDTLIIRGKKYLAWEIEDIVSSFEGVKPGRVIAFTHDSEQALCVAFEGRLSQKQTSDIGAKIRERFQVTVGTFFSLEPGTLIKTSSGKIARHKTLKKLKFL
jgi:fatty-acyl-CoA synthase